MICEAPKKNKIFYIDFYKAYVTIKKCKYIYKILYILYILKKFFTEKCYFCKNKVNKGEYLYEK